MVADPGKVDDELARKAVLEAETRQFAWSMYIVLEHRHRGNVIPSCSAEDFYAWMDQTLGPSKKWGSTGNGD